MHNSAFHDPGHNANVLREPTAVGLESAGHTNLLILRTLRKKLPLTIKTIAARNVVKACNAITSGPAVYTGSHVYDCACDLMPEYLRRLHQSVSNLFHVGSANTACRNAKQEFAVSDLGHNHFFGYNSTGATIHTGSHL
jgi:hypothetical protein